MALAVLTFSWTAGRRVSLELALRPERPPLVTQRHGPVGRVGLWPGSACGLLLTETPTLILQGAHAESKMLEVGLGRRPGKLPDHVGATPPPTEPGRGTSRRTGPR